MVRDRFAWQPPNPEIKLQMLALARFAVAIKKVIVLHHRPVKDSEAKMAMTKTAPRGQEIFDITAL